MIEKRENFSIIYYILNCKMNQGTINGKHITARVKNKTDYKTHFKAAFTNQYHQTIQHMKYSKSRSFLKI